MTSCTGSVRRISGMWRKLVELRLRHRTRRVDFRLLAEALGRCHTRWGVGRWKSQDRKIVALTPYVEKPLNSKVIRSFVPELRSRKCFPCFEISMFYVIYIWTLYVHFTHSRIWLWYIYIYMYIYIPADIHSIANYSLVYYIVEFNTCLCK